MFAMSPAASRNPRAIRAEMRALHLDGGLPMPAIFLAALALASAASTILTLARL